MKLFKSKEYNKKILILQAKHMMQNTQKGCRIVNSLEPINNIHFLIKRFMKQHGGYDRDNFRLDEPNLVYIIPTN